MEKTGGNIELDVYGCARLLKAMVRICFEEPKYFNSVNSKEKILRGRIKLANDDKTLGFFCEAFDLDQERVKSAILKDTSLRLRNKIVNNYGGRRQYLS